MLHQVQLRAIQLLSLGRSISDTATACKVSRSTLGRWKQRPDFQKVLDHELAGLQSNMHGQVQTLAREGVDGMLDANRELRALLLHDRTQPHIKCTASATVLRFGARWLDLMGYTLKAETPQKLYADRPPVILESEPELEAAAVATEAPIAQNSEAPLAREPRPGSEIDPVPAIFGANFASDIEHYRKDQLRAPECNSNYEDQRGGPHGPSDEIDPNARPRPIDYADETKGSGAGGQGPADEPEPVEYAQPVWTPEQLARFARMKADCSTSSNVSVTPETRCAADDPHATNECELTNSKEKLNMPKSAKALSSG